MAPLVARCHALEKRFSDFRWMNYNPVMKSAFELAMSRLEKESATRKLTDDQKSRLAEIDAEINAKIAERKLFLDEEIRKAAGDSQRNRTSQATLYRDCPPRGEAGNREGEDPLGQRGMKRLIVPGCSGGTFQVP